MLFNSHIFIFLFLPLVVLLHDLVSSRPRARQAVLLTASLAFYAYWSPWHLILLVASLLINYGLGELIHKASKSSTSAKTWMSLGVIFNLFYLGVFKYADFIAEQLSFILPWEVPQLGWILPLGISFYTFQQISFLIDTYQGQIKERDLLSYLTYVTFFPQLIAGPIVRYLDVRETLLSPWDGKNHLTERCSGLFLFSIGLAKKVLIADTMAPYVDTIYQAVGTGHSPAFLEAWLLILVYPFQLYFDFSGYSDMAVGLALIFGIHISWNFNAPFRSCSVSEYWQRWHMSLTLCFQRYLFNPMAMALRHRKTIWIRQTLPFVLTLTLIGVWHGSGWTFFLFGFWHGVALALTQVWKSLPLSRRVRLPRLLCWALTFMTVILALVWFRAPDVPSALRVFSGVFGLEGLILHPAMGLASGEWIRHSYYLFPTLFEHSTWAPLLAVFPAWALALFTPTSQHLLERFKTSRLHIVATVTLLTLCILKINEVSVFLYYQF